MINRITLKERGKAAFYRNYWMCVLVALIALVMLGSKINYSINSSDLQYTEDGFWTEFSNTVRHIPFRFILTGGVGLQLISIFVISTMEIGCDKFFLRNAMNQAQLGQVLDGFRVNYGRNVLTMFLVRLYTVLWTLLFVIPGIVKGYSYMLVPYILADTPEISRKEAIALSQQLMDGHKMDAFILELSFLGWYLLSAMTAGIVGIFFVNPYFHATQAEFYLALRYNRYIEQ